jgi:hypothetical protein
MALTKVQIISNAITLVGHKPIITLDVDDADDLVIAANQAFDFLLESSITENSWRFASRITQLTKVNQEVPLTNLWSSVYLLTPGYLKTIRLHPHNYQYEIFENSKLYTNWDGVMHMEDLFLPDISRLPAWFVKYFVFELAAYLALSNAQKAEYYNVLESKRAHQMGLAMAIDAQNRPQNTQANFPVLDASLRVTGDFYRG